ncbi:hypothetical protein [Catenulispora subtropica]|uniref:DUF2178 domain-containing protein n=1 Tax=Catenulispora subtropica TaxID=450798 RepID=A0ABN2SSD2_9ACTN
MSTGTEQGTGTGDGGRRGGGWAVPVTGVLIGCVYLAVFLARHDVPMALFGLGVMVAYVVALRLFSGRWETAALLGGDTGDERRRAIDERAAATTLRVLAPVLVVGFFVSAARGTGATTWAMLSAVVGGVYIVSTIVLTRRG